MTEVVKLMDVEAAFLEIVTETDVTEASKNQAGAFDHFLLRVAPDEEGVEEGVGEGAARREDDVDHPLGRWRARS